MPGYSSLILDGRCECEPGKARKEKNEKEDESKKIQLEDEKRPLFDIVAGTSIGATNGAILVSQFLVC